MASNSATLVILFLITYYLSFVFGQNATARNYTVDIKVSSLWYSGSGDKLYFQICNDNLNVNGTDNCLAWYEIKGGMENRGEWYYFSYLDQTDIGTITSMKLLSSANDQFCLTKIRVDGIMYDDESVSCVEVADHQQPGCDIVSIEFGTSPAATFTSQLYPQGTACPFNVNSNLYPGRPVIIQNGTRTYEIALTVSNLFYSGTRNDLYLRLCTHADRKATDCTLKCDDYSDNAATPNCESDWFIFVDGVNDEGHTYNFDWNTKDIGDIYYADIVTFGPDQFCLSELKVDGVAANAGTWPECISDDTGDGCATLRIDFANEEFEDTAVDPCSYGIMNNISFIAVDKYIFKFRIGDAFPYCGAEATIFFIFCTVDGSELNNQSCSNIYEIGGQMPDEDKEYTYTIDISDYALFNTISDIYFVDVWEYETEFFCLSDITIDGKISSTNKIINGPNADSGTPSKTIESPVFDNVFCSGVRVYMQTNQWDKFNDGPIKQNKLKKCRWNTLKDGKGTVLVSSLSDDESILDWMNKGYNWIYICAVLIVIVICCIVGCACLQAMKKKQKAEVEDTNRPWHGGNSAFYG